MEAASRLHFGTLLRQFRLDAGLTQQQLAERAKLSVEAIGALERGARTRPYRETVVLLARALELSPEREALLESAVDVPHPPRRRERVDALKRSPLRVVHRDTPMTPRHNLPHLTTSFVGRQNEVSEVTALLREHQLVTVVGAGGVGKTRIAVELGVELLDSNPDGAWLVDLAPLAEQTLVASKILSDLQLPSTTGSPSDVIIAYLKARRLLLILDNCEHVIAAAREVATSMVQSCPYLRILTTSREALDAPGERVYRLPSMAIPPNSGGSAKDALRYGAVALFVDRAHAVNSTFALVDENAPDVSEICRRLDGIPLAIELAAARVNVLAPRQVAERLDQRFRLLTGGNVQGLARHQTMTALIDWSYDFLTAREQGFFESLSVFAGGCTLEGATAVCATDGEDELDVIDLIASLAMKSLLVAELIGTEQRYHLLESPRQYARDKLTARGKQEQVARRHALAYLELAERLVRAWDTTPERIWLPQVKVESENLRAALDWTLAQRRDVILGQRLAAARIVVWRSFTLAEGRHWMRSALELIDESTPRDLVASLELGLSEGAAESHERKVSLSAAERALLRYREIGDAQGIVKAQILIGGSLALLGNPDDAEPILRQALEASRWRGYRRLEAAALQRLGWARAKSGDFTGAREHLTEALELANVLGADFFASSVSSGLAEFEFRTGNPETALRLTTGVLATARSLHDLPGVACALVNMASYFIALRRNDDARGHANEALELARSLRFAPVASLSLKYLAFAALLRTPTEARRSTAQHLRAARLLGFAEASRTTFGIPEDGLQQQYDRALTVLRETLGADKLESLMASGATMSEDEASAQAQALQ